MQLSIQIMFMGLLFLVNKSVDSKSVVTPGNGVYYLNELKQSWSEAYATCKSGGGHMAVIDTHKEYNLLQELLNEFNVDTVHIGFEDMTSEGNYSTLTGIPLDRFCDTQWAVDEPKEGTANNCGWLKHAGLGIGDCLEEYYSICELPSWRNYDLVPGYGYYRYHPEWRNWQEAYMICKFDGAHLLVANSQEEIQQLDKKYSPGSNIWVGVHSLFGNDQFVTVFNEPLNDTGYSTWYGNEPSVDDTTIAPYIMLRFHDADFGLITAAWYHVSAFICERSLH